MSFFSFTPVGILDSQAREYILNLFPNLLEKIEYKIEDFIPDSAHNISRSGRADGAYEHDTKTIFLQDSSTLHTAIHEIGHAVHYQLFGAREFTFDEEGKSRRACINYKEDFCDAFADAIIRFNQNEALTTRDQEIFTYLKTI